MLSGPIVAQSGIKVKLCQVARQPVDSGWKLAAPPYLCASSDAGAAHFNVTPQIDTNEVPCSSAGQRR
jgi:hypothetical protein